MNNLKLFRRTASLKGKQLSSLLLVSAHVYGYYEKDLPLPPETAVMLSKIYKIDVDQIFCSENEITNETMETVESISKLQPEQQNSLLALNLSNGEYEKLNFKKLWYSREQIHAELIQEKAARK